MRRSEINALVRDAKACFEAHGWALPERPRWDVTDFGLGDWKKFGLVLINLAEEPEYCEKLMYAKRGMVTPAHTHRVKKEDIVVRWGKLDVSLWSADPRDAEEVERPVKIKIDGVERTMPSGTRIALTAGRRITLWPGTFHEFAPSSDEVILGEVSTANDDQNDNVFSGADVGRFPGIEEDEPAEVALVGDR